MLVYPSFALVSIAVQKPFFSGYRAVLPQAKLCSSMCSGVENEGFEWGRAPPSVAIALTPRS